MKRFVFLVLFFALAGCAAEPFPMAQLPPLTNPDPKSMVESFARSQANQFISDDTVIIEAPFHDDLAMLGALQVDRSKGTFELVALTHMGVKLFELSGDRDGMTIRFAIQPLLKRRDLLLAMATDIRRMFFDLTPPSDARVDIGSTKVRFSQDGSQGKLVYEFGGDPAVLLAKHLDGFFGDIWRVRYFQYQPTPIGLYPHGIVMDNHEFHYRIIVKNRDQSTP